jgi:hypothetical protein
MNSVNCPACRESAFDQWEPVDVAGQHTFYSLNDVAMHQRLTVAAQSVLEYQMLKCLHCGLEFSVPMRAPSAVWSISMFIKDGRRRVYSQRNGSNADFVEHLCRWLC